MNTTEVDNGSRWIQDTTETSIISVDVNQERYLVKWDELSYLHCSWETKEDLLELCTNGEQSLAEFTEKNVDGMLYGEEERNGGVSAYLSCLATFI